MSNNYNMLKSCSNGTQSCSAADSVIEANKKQGGVGERLKAPEKPYYAGIDIVKIFAVFSVIGVHFFLNSGFYSIALNENKYIPFLVLRYIFYNCVPLFMISTGYLMRNKKFSLGYYKGIIKIIVIYLFISFICIKFSAVHYGSVYTKWTILKGMLTYTNDGYSWYVNYYLSLFVIIPFLNSAFNGLQTRNQKLALVIILTLITIAARSFYIGFVPENQTPVIPYYLSEMWPLSYYFAGAYLRDYPPKSCRVQTKLIAAVLFCAALGFITWSTLSQSRANIEGGQIFTSRHFDGAAGYGTYPIFVMSVCIFILLFDIKSSNKIVKFILRHIGETTLAVYLISAIFDSKNYNGLVPEYKTIHQKLFFFLYRGDFIGFNQKYADVYTRCTHCYEIIFKNFFSSLFWGIIITNGYKLCEYGVRKGCSAIYKKLRAEKKT